MDFAHGTVADYWTLGLIGLLATFFALRLLFPPAALVRRLYPHVDQPKRMWLDWTWSQRLIAAAALVVVLAFFAYRGYQRAGLAGVGLTAGFFFVVVGLKVLLSWSRYR
jgi:hypothetical protein